MTTTYKGVERVAYNEGLKTGHRDFLNDVEPNYPTQYLDDVLESAWWLGYYHGRAQARKEK